MALASNYRRWIMDLFTPFIGRHIVEVGAGAGAFSEMLLGMEPATLTVLEPSSNLFPVLQAQLAPLDRKGVMEVRQSSFMDAAEANRRMRPFDTAIYINVLEHIEHDQAELNAVFHALPPGGRMLIFVPALPFLMGRLDYEVGHFRRYTLRELKSKCSAAGFSIKMAHYFDALGILPWWIKFCLLKSNTIEPAAVRINDRWVVPVSRAIESVLTPPLGKNVILVAEK